MTASVARRHTAARAEGAALTGAGVLLRLALRRDRIKLPAWTLGIALLIPYFSAVIARVNPDRASLQTAVEAMNVPLLRLFAGPAFGLEEATLQRYLISAYFVEFLLLAPLMNILLIARHTRAEEQSGRAELIRAAVVGRHASLTAAFVLAVITNAVLALLMTATAIGVGLPAGSALLFGAGTAATGLVFAAVTGVTAQLTERSRAAGAIAGAVLGVVWLIRAIGALQDLHGSWVTWLSPMAWAQHTQVLADERWWPLTLSVLLTGVVMAIAYGLSARRDLCAGLVAVRPGPARASGWLRSPAALALRLQRPSILGWGIGLGAAGLVLGGLTSAMREGMAAEFIGGDLDMVDGYLSLTVVFLAVLVGIFTVLSVTRARSEEVHGRVAPLLATPTGRWAWFGSTLLVTALAAVALLALSGLTLGLGAALSLGDSAFVGEVSAVMLARVPEVLVMLAIAAALFGFAPRALAMAWIVLAYGGGVRFWGTDLPSWLQGLSPFNHIPRMPIEDFRLTPLVVLTALAAALALIGLYGFRRRDVDGT
jgi:ABC-2 type transport system permease protein